MLTSSVFKMLFIALFMTGALIVSTPASAGIDLATKVSKIDASPPIGLEGPIFVKKKKIIVR